MADSIVEDLKHRAQKKKIAMGKKNIFKQSSEWKNIVITRPKTA